MIPCPHCQFLVPRDAETCGVCKQPIAIPEQPAGPWGADPGPAFQAADAGAATAGSTAGRGSRAPLVIGLVVAAAVALVVLAFMFVGVRTDRVDVAGADWSSFRSPDSAFSVELPGSPKYSPDAAVGTAAAAQGVHVSTVTADDRSFASLVGRYALPPGAGYDPGQGLKGAAAGIGGDVRVASSSPVSTPIGNGMDGVLTGTRNGTEIVALARIVVVGSVPYAVVTVGPPSRRDELQQIQDRVTGSLSVPAAG